MALFDSNNYKSSISNLYNHLTKNLFRVDIEPLNVCRLFPDGLHIFNLLKLSHDYTMDRVYIESCSSRVFSSR